MYKNKLVEKSMVHTELLKDIFFVGYVDWEIRNFHGYSTHRGSSYNAYIVKGEKTVLIDTVKRPYFNHFLESIRSVIEPEKIDYFIVNHVEMDHSGSFPLIIKHLPNAQIIATERGIANLKAHFHQEVEQKIFENIKAVKEGDTLDIGGGKTFTFVPIPMIHWPDSMVSFMADENGSNILFSNDGFGQHCATSKPWDEDNDFDIVMQEAAKYYANILLHLSKLIEKILPKVGALPIDLICPSHGVCWKKHVGDIIGAYNKWAKGEIDNNTAIIVYDTMWGSTEIIAKALYKELKHRGIRVKRFKLTTSDYSDIITEAMNAKVIIVGSPTLNNGLYPTVAEYLSYQRGLKPMKKIGLAFGSYGWGGGAVKEIIKELEATQINVLDEKIEIQFVPRPEDLDFKSIIDKLIEKMK